MALLAFQRIAESHTHLVSAHQEIIFGCLDDPDISIRLKALDIGSQVINAENLTVIVSRLLDQLQETPSHGSSGVVDNSQEPSTIEPAADQDNEDPEEALRQPSQSAVKDVALNAEYHITVINRILEMCSRDAFANIDDFEWYIQVLVDLLRFVPHGEPSDHNEDPGLLGQSDVSATIGTDLRNIAVRVPSMRPATVEAAASLLAYPATKIRTIGPNHAILGYAAWIAGEYADVLSSAETTLDHMMQAVSMSLRFDVLQVCLQALPKILALVLRRRGLSWGLEAKSMTSLLMARTTDLLEPLALHPDLEVQERAVECLELARLSMEAIYSHDSQSATGPTILTAGIPSLFGGSELNPVASTAQRKVPAPEGFDFEEPLSASLAHRLNQAQAFDEPSDSTSAQCFYFEKSHSQHPAESGSSNATTSSTLQRQYETGQRLERTYHGDNGHHGRHQGDPFYIKSLEEANVSHNTAVGAVTGASGSDVDVDSIPIMDLGLSGSDSVVAPLMESSKKPKKNRKTRVHVAPEENPDVLDQRPAETEHATSSNVQNRESSRALGNFLQVDSSEIGRLDFDQDATADLIDDKREEEEMAKALANVEKMRMEMQRAAERTALAGNVTPDGALVKKKTKKKRKKVANIEEGHNPGTVGGNGHVYA